MIQKNDRNCQGTCSPYYIISSALCLISLVCSDCNLKLKQALYEANVMASPFETRAVWSIRLQSLFRKQNRAPKSIMKIYCRSSRLLFILEWKVSRLTSKEIITRRHLLIAICTAGIIIAGFALALPYASRT